MGKGKKGKVLGSLLFFGLGSWGASLGWFGKGVSWVTGGLYGSSIAGTLWSTFNKPKQDDFDTGTINRFDKVMNTMSSTATIPVIYGERKWGGNQTYHKTNAEQNTLRKHIVLCEGDIEGVVSVCANDLLIGEAFRRPAITTSVAKKKECSEGYPMATYQEVARSILVGLE